MRLLDTYAAALAEFHQAQGPLLGGVLPHDPDYEPIRSLKQLAFEELAGARRQYWNHTQKHGCRLREAIRDTH
jgi:hypothetical protein